MANVSGLVNRKPFKIWHSFLGKTLRVVFAPPLPGCWALLANEAGLGFRDSNNLNLHICHDECILEGSTSPVLHSSKLT